MLLEWMEYAVGFYELQGLGERLTAVQAEPGSCVPMPLNVEAVLAEPIQSDEGGVEFFTQVAWKP